MITEDSFAAFVSQAGKEQSRGFVSAYPREYEEVKWSGLQKGVPSILRFVGKAPDAIGRDKTDAKSMYISWIVSDSGSQFKWVRPTPSDDPNHIFNRFLRTVTKGKWNDETRTKSYVLESKDSELLNKVLKNGRTPEDPQYNYERGWLGREMYLVNVIDRTQMQWHKDHKHTMLLAGDMRTSPDGREFVTEGVSKPSLKPKILHLFECYGDWSKYDIALTRTGVKDNPYIAVNASKVPEEVKPDYRRYISTEPLTAEEASWERYDLDKIFAPTSATKFLNRMKDTITKVDKLFNTHFLQEFEALSAKEKEQWKQEYGDEFQTSEESSASNPVTLTEADEKTLDIAMETAAVGETLYDPACDPLAAPMETPKEEAPKRVVRKSASVTSPEQLPYFTTLTAKDQAFVKETFRSATQVSDVKWDSEWDTSKGFTLLECPECGSFGPDAVLGCPFCGTKFEG